jgi:NAD(P)-dependent dehydrogenase (short-subunit alcohol dehydrogenase family)
MEISKHTFFITGGNSGLGAATARHLLQLNANVVIADLNIDQEKSLVEGSKPQTLFIHTDVTNSDSVEAALSRTQERFGPIHGLINCAGILVAERLIKKDGSLFNLASFRLCLEVNLVGTFNMIRLVSAQLSNNQPNNEGERGVIINTSSIAAYEGQIGQAAYAASKAGIIGMTLPIARELGRKGIRIMTIAPGVFATPLLSGVNDSIREDLEKQIPFPGRLGKPSEYAALVQHIIENPMLNGDVIRLDGAIRM